MGGYLPDRFNAGLIVAIAVLTALFVIRTCVAAQKGKDACARDEHVIPVSGTLFMYGWRVMGGW